MSLKEVFEQATTIEYLCSIQSRCKGNIATGTLTMNDALQGQLQIPVCDDCAQYVAELRAKRLTELSQSATLDAGR